MNIFDKAISAMGLQRKSWSTSDPRIAAFLAGTSSSQVANPYANVSGVYNAVKAIIDNISQAKLVLVGADGEKIEGTKYNDLLALTGSVKDISGSYFTNSEFLQWLSGYHSLAGESFLIKEVETEGQLSGTKLPSSLTLVSPRNVEEVIKTTEQGQVVVGWKINNKNYLIDEVIQIKDFNPYNDVHGQSAVGVIEDEINMDTLATVKTNSQLENGGDPSLILEMEKGLNPKQRDSLRQAFEGRHSGAKNSGKMAIFDNGLKAKTLSHSNREMELLELLKYADTKIVGTWRVPKAMFGMTDDLNYATFLGQLKVFWTMTLIPLLNRIEDSLNKELAIPYTAGRALYKFDLSNVDALQDNINEFADSITKLTSAGFTRNEINERFKLGFEDKAWGDSWWIPFSQVPAGETLETPEKGLKKKANLVHHTNGLTYTKQQFEHMKNFNHLHDNLHKKFYSAMRTYFRGQRKRVLDAYDDKYKGMTTKNNTVYINLNWGQEEDILAEALLPYEKEAIEQGIKQGERVSGISASSRLGIIANSATTQRIELAKSLITKTSKEEINRAINIGINEGESVTEIKDRIKGYFNKTDNRAEAIARTEITAQLNGGLLLQYDDAGFEKKEWITTIDQFTRDAHAMAHNQIRAVGKPFEVGGEYLMQPGGAGGSAGNVINCRCSVYPVLEE